MDRRDRLLTLFPRLAGTAFRITSPPADRYNCIAWCAADVLNWWWPVGDHPHLYWPAGVSPEETLGAFRSAFAPLGYADCSSAGHESGIEKVAIFAKSGTVPTHGARQLPSGLWTSKLGKAEDVEHALYDLEGALYGNVVAIFSRRTTVGPNSSLTQTAPAAPAS